MKIFSFLISSKFFKYLIIILLLLELKFIIIKNSSLSTYSDKWIIITAFKSNNNKIDIKWKELNYSNKIIYLTLKEQMKLGYSILKFLSFNSYARKNIGYLYAIQHGAKEIFEINEDIVISDLNSFNLNFNNIYFGIRNDSKMINPYIHFGENHIWPRGFRLRDIGSQCFNKFYTLDSTHLKLTPLIYQGIINGVPDIDSIFQKTKITNYEYNFSFIDPLIYFPGYFIPINSKNTKYLYSLFPFLALPSTISEKISDILRGYILQYFAWRYNGCVVYHSSHNYNRKKNISKNTNFIEEKNLFYSLDNYLDVLNKASKLKINEIDTLFYIIKNLVNLGFLGEKDLKIYKAYIDDLSNIGYTYTSKFVNQIKYNYNEYITSSIAINSYFPYKPYEFLKINHKNIKSFYHQKPLMKYEILFNI
jgi:hypothetical protein